MQGDDLFGEMCVLMGIEAPPKGDAHIVFLLLHQNVSSTR